MTRHRPVKGLRPQLAGVIASPGDFRFATQMKQPPDLFELRLDCLRPIASQLEKEIPRLRAPLIITARDPLEGGIGSLSLEKRRELLLRFLPYAKYVDVELRSARAFQPLLGQARKQNVRVILSFHNFKSTPSSRSLYAMARAAKAMGADIFKVATRTDTPIALARLVGFIASKHRKVPISAMGTGRLGALSRLLLARCGSILNYASFGRPTVEGQLPIELLRSALPR
jgi:3-dehydroquinate dehydratase-1